MMTDQKPIAKADRLVKITGTDRRGVGRLWTFQPGPKVKALLKKLKYDVAVRDAEGNKIGGVWKMDGHWVWAIEAWAIGEPEQFKRQQITSYPS